jgi:hypothetical protein
MTIKTGPKGLRAALMNAASAASLAAAAVIGAGSASAIVINNNYTPTQAVDTAGGVNGVGQMVIDTQDGFIGLCTMSLINPRTVIFAAHCVNERAANTYGASGTFDIAVFFNVNNNAAGNSAIGRWLNPATGNFQTDTSRFTYTLNQVQYNDASLEPNAAGFLYADVAIGTLDTPAVGIPTWAMLFSPLPVPASIDNETGTGYHVNITGYGNNGTAATGSTGGIDYRRRAAENMLGGLASLDAFEDFLFGPGAGVNPQNLYWIDFDSPETPSTTDTARSNPQDFNAWKDDFTTREGTTASGDSGGPLILDAANNVISTRDLILGVLSGGYTRFYNGAPANGYGTASFYQPLYLYWDYIAAANPYRYASALAGNGNWEDATHWQSLLDPNYIVISGSTGVNGIPTAPGAGPVGDEPTFGQICFEGGGTSDCLDTTTGIETIGPTPVDGAGTYTSDIGRASIADLVPEMSGSGNTSQSIAGLLDPVAPTPQAAYLPGPNPAATLANGLPGATNFVPNNIDPSLGVLARYFDITLSAAGTTTLSSVVTIDRLRVASTAGLTIGAAGNLSSLIDVTQTGGTILVNGRLRSVGDYSLMAGTLGGVGTIQAPFLTSLMGGIAPGATGVGSVGTLSVQGSVILASASGYMVDIASAVSADRLTVTGALNLGGTFLASTIGGYTPNFGNSWTVASATGGITGSFSSIGSTFGGVLSPQLTLTGNNLILSIIAANFTDVADFTSPEQFEVASVLDDIRDTTGGYAGLANLFNSLDQTPVGALPAVMEALVPLNGFVAGGVAEANAAVVAGALVDRTDQLMLGGGHGFDASGASAMLNASALQASADPFDAMMMGSVAVAAAQDAAAETAASAASIKLREGWGGFLDVTTMLNTSYEATPFAGDAGLDGTGGSIGLDYGFSDGSFAGAALSYVSTNADVLGGLQTADSDSWGVSLYGGVHEGSSFLTGYVGYAMQSYDLSRTVPLFLGTQTLTASPDGTIFSAGAKMGFDIEGAGGVFTPYGSIDGKWINIDGYTETGGSAALVVDPIDTALVDGRLGVTYSGVYAMEGGVIRPKLGVAYVIDVQSDDNVLNSAFAGFPSAPLTFIGSDRDNGWVEFEAGLEYEGSNFGLSVNYTGGNNGVLTYNTLSGRVSFAW